jgi:hypothetical protein
MIIYPLVDPTNQKDYQEYFYTFIIIYWLVLQF